MKALSMFQPWAWAVVEGHKPVENRYWQHPPTYRGLLAVHAGRPQRARYHAHAASRIERASGLFPPKAADLPYSAVVGVVRLVDALRSPKSLTDAERAWADPEASLYLIVRPVLVLDEPVPMAGRLGLFDLPAAVERRVWSSLRAHERAMS